MARRPQQRRRGLVGVLRRLQAGRCGRVQRRRSRLRQRRCARVAEPAPVPSAAAAAPAAAPGARTRCCPGRRSRLLPAPAPAAPPSPTGRRRAPARRPSRSRASPPRSSPTWSRASSCPPRPACAPCPAKLLIDNRIIINNHLRRGRGGKVSFTHLIGYALVKALGRDARDEQLVRQRRRQAGPGDPRARQPRAGHRPAEGGRLAHAGRPVHQGLPRRWTSARFWRAYEEVVRRARTNKLTLEDYAGTTISLTNPGTIGTVHSVPRLMPGQGTIIGVGAMEYPAEFQGASPHTLADLGISKTMTLTSTYDHRIIQGAQSGDFLRRVHQLLLGDQDFYDEIFTSLRIPYEPVRWVTDLSFDRDDQVGKQARIIELIHAYRERGHLMADTNPLEFELRRHPDLDVVSHGLTLWDLDRDFGTGGFAGKQRMALRDILGVLRDSYCRSVGVEYMHIQDPAQRRWIQERVETGHAKPPREEQLRILGTLNQAEAFETFLQTKFVGQRRFSLEGAESTIAALDAILDAAAHDGLDEVCIGMPHRGRLNVLANIVGKSYAQIFREFEGKIDPRTAHGSGDVKYHLGAEGTFTSYDGTKIPVSLASNPSPPRGGRLGARGRRAGQAGPAQQGRGRRRLLRPAADAARRRRLRRPGRRGRDAQPVPAARLPHRRHGPRRRQQPGRLHHRARRQPVQRVRHRRGQDGPGPILHVNGDDPEAVVRVAKLAFEYRQAFAQGRRHRPALLPPPRPLRGRRAVLHPAADVRPDRRQAQRPQALHRGADRPRRHLASRRPSRRCATTRSGWRRCSSRPATPSSTGTAPDAGRRQRRRPPGHLGQPPRCCSASPPAQLEVPEGFTVHPRLLPMLQRRTQMLDDDAVDWAMGETLAFGSLLMEGRPVRLAGQDSRRGTFGQRHSVLIDRADRRRAHPAALPRRGPGPVLRLRLAAQRVRRARLRVRLLGGPAAGAGAVGGAVRRLRQRRPVDHRRVHLGRRGQVGPALAASACCCRTATRARVRTTPPPGSSASSRCAPRTT